MSFYDKTKDDYFHTEDTGKFKAVRLGQQRADALNKGAYQIVVEQPPPRAIQFVKDSSVLVSIDSREAASFVGYNNRLTLPSGFSNQYFTAIPR